MKLSTNYQNIACPDVNVQGKVKRQYLNLNIVVFFILVFFNCSIVIFETIFFFCAVFSCCGSFSLWFYNACPVCSLRNICV